jgi:hypothetical protein
MHTPLRFGACSCVGAHACVCESVQVGKLAVGRLCSLKALILNDNRLTMVGGVDRLTQLDTLVLSRWGGGACARARVCVCGGGRS